MSATECMLTASVPWVTVLLVGVASDSFDPAKAALALTNPVATVPVAVAVAGCAVAASIGLAVNPVAGIDPSDGSTEETPRALSTG